MKNNSILIIEDNTLLSESLELILTAANYHVKIVPSLETLQEYLSRTPPCVILMDLNLPETEPARLVHYVRDRYVTSKIILTSGDPRLNNRFAHLADAINPKPFDLDELNRLLYAWCSQNANPSIT